MPRSGLLKILNLLGLLSTFFLIAYGTPWQWTIVLIIFFLSTCVGGAMVWHRLLSHKSWKAPRWVEVAGTLIKTVMLAGSSITYVAIHREHHAHADTTKDPHSPLNGILKVHYKPYAYKLKLFRAGDLLRDPFHLFLHKNYLSINLIYASLVMAIFQDVFALTYAWLAPGFISIQAASLVNSLNHLWGYRNFATNDNSKNNLITGYLGFGEGWHNNHHAFPTDSYTGKKWWEFDLTGWLIKRVEIK